ncbi:MAG TPA: hypothetical protein VI336_00865 [Candidatus Saccharimonadales bacterium]|nr:hypothetical protein [Candidatus Saccharimonadales bacterium]
MSKPRMFIVSTNADFSLSLYNAAESRKLIEPHSVMFNASEGALDRVMQNDFQYLYFRDPFNEDDDSRKIARANTSKLLRRYRSAYMVDGIKNFDDLLFEDKWKQYRALSKFMPPTKILTVLREPDRNSFIKRRISARSKGIIFTREDYPVNAKPQEYLIQQKLQVEKEYRAYMVGGRLVSPMAIKSSKTPQQNVRLIGLQKEIPQAILKICQAVYDKTQYDLCGLDVAETKDGFFLLEVNRSCQFKKYWQLSGQNLAASLSKHLLALH